MEYFATGSESAELNQSDVDECVDRLLAQIGSVRRLLLVPPDLSRLHSGAGPITIAIWNRLRGRAEVKILPAVGTHRPMTALELDRMYPGIPVECFLVHDFRNDVSLLGEIDAEFTKNASKGAYEQPIRVELSRQLLEGQWDAIISIGQLVPHEVAGVANHNKNILVGLGGSDFINKSHFVGAVFGMERIMGRSSTPVRDIFNEADRRFLTTLPIHYVLTVRQRLQDGRIATRGLFAGDDDACFLRGAELCRKVNFNLLDREINKAVVYLDPHEFKSTWLGNKAIYRTRMAMADGGELFILAPGVREFGEDSAIDAAIRQFGYRGTPFILDAVRKHANLANNLSAAAHLIHGSSEGRFQITYCPGGLTREEIEGVGFQFADYQEIADRFPVDKLQDGWNTRSGEEFFFVSNPGLGLWGHKKRLFGG